ncbi:hypothetical protein EOS93_25125 [Rhizobium sp. RMa-01]|uniref:hypothetical protein n=1 Tax=unclassified Rhizobium TaxID=2613769 RepID=UPI0008DAD7BD|nr:MULTISPECIES: hypothetical protein [unclassified Rhizobium]OHV24955.1 hypothetical protein BBJ66_22710 [Rhizobium sp. RSm-3]RVU08338.1 hypothetical protein EOS93_25125 [Rhizobium sp. RMa-01]
MANQSGIAITIRAFLPTGKTLDEQFTALGLVRDAHASGDYTALLKAASVEEVKTEQKTRRVEIVATNPQPESGTAGDGDESGLKGMLDGVPPVGAVDDAGSEGEPAGTVGGAQMEGDDGAEVPAFLKPKKGKAAA